MLFCNLCRICMSVAVIPAAQELGWSAGVQGLIQSSFLWGYMATQLVGGGMADRFGGKATMAVSVAWFSLATCLTPAAAAVEGIGGLLAARFLVGLGQGLTLPSMNSLVGSALPANQRSKGLGVAFTGFHTGNIVGLLVSPLIIAGLGWRALFYVYALCGLPVLLLWGRAVPRGAAPAATAAGGAAPGFNVLALLKHPPVLAIIAANFVNHWGYFIYLNWMPSYFYRTLDMSVTMASLLSFLPWAVMAVASSVSGWVADELISRGVATARVRKLAQAFSFVGPALSLVLLGAARTPAAACVCLVLALGCQAFGQAGFVANMSDVAPGFAGRLFGLSNTFGSLAGIVGVAFAGYSVQATGSFAQVFQVTTALYLAGTAVYLAAASADVLPGLGGAR